ncbi:twin-arginine translocation pathway signal [Lysobacter sp. H21R4]|uniref:BPSL1445 family SYLF domain-containing lipoprotein n=1 Tax=Lysobacter sp. H21R4 TaxID=2781021 RepID=UPI00188777E7|nr:YSC84-related protein [Lysobacter sp. H21R4]QOY63777.1 twin-arginine translocation pathway signal [Lysobacter sp. H21R4]
MTSQVFRPVAMASVLALCAFMFVGCTTTSPSGRTDVLSSTGDIDAQTDAALARLYSEVPGARELGSAAKGILVFPSVVGGSFVVGAEYGRGSLRTTDSPRRYYSIAVGSVGWQVGAQSKSVIYMFTTTESLNKFRNSKGWTAGVDATVAVANIGANGSVDTSSMEAPVVAFVLANTGLEVGASVQGMKVTELSRK